MLKFLTDFDFLDSFVLICNKRIITKHKNSSFGPNDEKICILILGCPSSKLCPSSLSCCWRWFQSKLKFPGEKIKIIQNLHCCRLLVLATVYWLLWLLWIEKSKKVGCCLLAFWDNTLTLEAKDIVESIQHTDPPLTQNVPKSWAPSPTQALPRKQTSID